jgi:hypothetical protein
LLSVKIVSDSQTHSVLIKEKIMKASMKFVTGLMLAAGALAASSNVAIAGEGGAAGSVAIQFRGAVVNPTTGATGISDISSAVAVGKNSAATTARTSNVAPGPFATDNSSFASAVGGGGALVLDNANGDGDYALNQDANFGTAQENDLSTTATIAPSDLRNPASTTVSLPGTLD